MLSFEEWIAFATATFLFAYMPGPALLYAAAQTLAGGRHRGFQAALGIHLGGYFHVGATALGFTSILTAVPTAYGFLKAAGAVYLVWLGLQLILQAKKTTAPPDIEDEGGPSAEPPPKPLRQSALVEILNPKTALFFYAFLPQFVDPSSSVAVWLQFVILGTLVNLTFSSADIACVVFSGWVSRTLRRSNRASAWARSAGGTILIGLGAHLALDRP